MRLPRRRARRWTFASCPPDSGWSVSSAKRHGANAEARAEALGVEFVRGAKVAGLTQDGDGVTVDVVDGETVRADYVVGCDGAHSAVRTLLGIDFVGKQYETHILLADVRLESAARRNAIRQDEFRWRDALRAVR